MKGFDDNFKSVKSIIYKKNTVNSYNFCKEKFSSYSYVNFRIYFLNLGCLFKQPFKDYNQL